MIINESFCTYFLCACCGFCDTKILFSLLKSPSGGVLGKVVCENHVNT